MRLELDIPKVKELRLLQYGTQAALAEAAGVDVKTIEHAECGWRVSIPTIHNIARALRVQVTDIARVV